MPEFHSFVVLSSTRGNFGKNSSIYFRGQAREISSKNFIMPRLVLRTLFTIITISFLRKVKPGSGMTRRSICSCVRRLPLLSFNTTLCHFANFIDAFHHPVCSPKIDLASISRCAYHFVDLTVVICSVTILSSS